MHTSPNANVVNLWWQTFLLPSKSVEIKSKLPDSVKPAIQNTSEIPKKRWLRKIIPVAKNKTAIRHLRYYLGSDYPGVYITQRELDCLRLYAKDLTLNETAQAMEISYRACESLVVSMRKKCNCAMAADLLQHLGLAALLRKRKPRARKRRLSP